ncbi:Bis(5'-adenosyl)-triphosphatase [Metarhizium album ARSEF 1941]|uniref:Bis(5'-adenosyl)-triphosphatase n=1 Tax=Metarhizium album (strain ARSEF 1941) TaxID=1081103 RepID=A0A0B2WZA4_METAS|nr:Bis(5'-adenosyl)-triphosphatase [Metarhizium album ARSEF 1941]KHN98185.1 Bis(5'-adenosyl)-triphosphatase [Metarhizium album ARSEF 1941]
MTSTKTEGMSIHFGPFEVTKQVFLTTPHSYALVNLKPLIPGHILVCPLKPHPRLTDLSPAETADLFCTVQLAQRMLAQKYLPEPGNLLSGSFTVAVQDGPDSGQTVPHLHVHVIPRRKGDVGDSPDAIYVKMSSEDGNVGGAMWDRERRPAPAGGMPRIEDADRDSRTPEQMEEEAEEYKKILRKLGVA